MIQRTVHYFQPDFQKIEDVDSGIAYWRIELAIDEDNDVWLVVESPDLKEALQSFANQVLDNWN